MKGVSTILLLLTACRISLSAQMTSPVRIKAGEDLYEKLAHEIYLYPEFVKGIISFRDGKMNQSNFNYNLLNGELQFIGDKGDTLSLANELTIKYVNIAKDTFFYSEGYLQLVAGNETVKIARKQRIKIIDQQKIGGYDQPTTAGAVTSYGSMTNSAKNIKLDIRQDIILAKQTSFFFSDKYNNFFKANKKNLVRAFHLKEDKINEYLRNNHVDFNKEADLVKIIEVLKD